MNSVTYSYSEQSKVLLITRNLPPLSGGMEVLNAEMARGLSQSFDVSVMGPQGSEITSELRQRFVALPLQPLWRFMLAALAKGLRQVANEKPSVVLGGSGLMAPVVLLLARMRGAHAVIYLHGLDIAVDHWLYQRVWTAAIRRADRLIVNSEPSAQLARNIGVPNDRIRVVHPGVSLPKDWPSAEQLEAFRIKYQLEGKQILLSVGRLTTRKGLLEFVENALPAIVERCPESVLLVIGDAPQHALYAKAQTPTQIAQAARALRLDKHVRFIGTLPHAQLREPYCAAAVHVFPVREIAGDPEGFGMVAIEAASHGLPTVAFRTGGVVDAVAEGESGYLVAPNDYAEFANRVCKALEMRETLRASAQAFAQGFAWPNFHQKVQNCLDELLQATDQRSL